MARRLVATGELTDGIACLDIVDICTNLRLLLHDNGRVILRKSIERREAGWDFYLAVFVSLNQPSLFDVEVNTIEVAYDICKDLTI